MTDLLYQNFPLMATFAFHDRTWKSLSPIILENLIFVTWTGTLLHTLVPALDAATRGLRWSDIFEVFGMDVQDYPWLAEPRTGGIALADDELMEEVPLDRKNGIHLV